MASLSSTLTYYSRLITSKKDLVKRTKQQNSLNKLKCMEGTLGNIFIFQSLKKNNYSKRTIIFTSRRSKKGSYKIIRSYVTWW